MTTVIGIILAAWIKQDNNDWELFFLYGCMHGISTGVVFFSKYAAITGSCLLCRGAGKVFQARNKRTDKEAAIKLMDLGNQLSLLGLIAQEVSILRTVRHANIINFIGMSRKFREIRYGDCMLTWFIDNVVSEVYI